uniref:helix-turn-helix domain-containing protein n=1 Tax=Eisenbergiella tayi TaxID=1432052 RepID=UPI003FF13C24
MSRKVDTACLLLRNTGLTVKEIAYRLQFSDEHYFSNLFRQRTGSPPGKYKEGR